MKESIIKDKMHKLENLIGYMFTDLSLLEKAMYSKKKESLFTGKNHKEYSNEGLALVGDAILKSVLADKLYQDGVTSKGELTKCKEALENNEVLSEVAKKYHITDYAYNDFHFNDEENVPNHEKVLCNKHDPYVEAIIGAIYYDSDYYVARNWILNWLYEKLDDISKFISSINNL